MALKNGQRPDDVLVTVGKDYYGRPARFRPEAAASWNRMRAAGMPMDVSDTYRDLARQKEYEKNPPNSVGLAAKAGTSSHGWGLAVDARGACLTWLETTGAKHGWIRTIKAEPWHFEYFPDRDQHAQEDDVSVEDVIKALESPAGKKALADAIIGPNARYQTRNPVRPEELWNLPTAAQVIADYVIRDYKRGANIESKVLALEAKLASVTGAEVDEAALARELAPLVAGNVASLSDDALAAIATAVNNEADHRARQRLG